MNRIFAGFSMFMLFAVLATASAVKREYWQDSFNDVSGGAEVPLERIVLS